MRRSVTSHNRAHEVISIKVEEDIDVGTQEMITVPISFPPIKAEQDGVSYVHLHPFLDTFPQYPEMPGVLCCLHLSKNYTVININFFLFHAI
jgi:hypothetical protein